MYQGYPGAPHTTVVVNTGPTYATVPGKAPGAGSVVLNLLWLYLSGFWLFLGYLLSGLFQCVTIVGIPFGIQGSADLRVESTTLG